LYAKRAYAHDALGDSDKALRDYQRAVELYPNNAEAQRNIAALYSSSSDDKIRDGKKAWTHANKAYELEPDDRDGINIVAQAYAESVEFDEAVRWQKKAFTKTRDLGDHGGLTKEEMRSRLKLYQQKKPFHSYLRDGAALERRKQFPLALAKYTKG